MQSVQRTDTWKDLGIWRNAGLNIHRSSFQYSVIDGIALAQPFKLLLWQQKTLPDSAKTASLGVARIEMVAR